MIILQYLFNIYGIRGVMLYEGMIIIITSFPCHHIITTVYNMKPKLVKWVVCNFQNTLDKKCLGQTKKSIPRI